MNANTMSIEDVIQTLDTRYQLSPYLKLRGHISYKAARLAGMYCAQQAKLIKDSQDENNCDIDTFAQAMATVRARSTDDILLNEMGMESDQDSLYNTIKGLVMYANRLNFDMQEIVDPTAKKREDAHWKQRGVYFTEAQQRQSWLDSLALIAEGNKTDAGMETYAEYVAKLDNPKWALDEEEWAAQQVDDNSLYADYNDVIADVLIDIGNDECYFDEMPIRAQIAAIENMRGKIPSMLESALKSLKYERLDKTQRTLEASKLKGLITIGFNELFCSMLDSSRYANHIEFMYNYIPTRTTASAPVTRRMVARNERAEASAIINGKRSDEEMAKANDDFLEMESDVV